jgi:hypothetical protein
VLFAAALIALAVTIASAKRVRRRRPQAAQLHPINHNVLAAGALPG